MKKLILISLVMFMPCVVANAIDYSKNVDGQIRDISDRTYSRQATQSSNTYYNYSNRQSAQNTSNSYSGRNNSYTPTTTRNSSLGWKMYD